MSKLLIERINSRLEALGKSAREVSMASTGTPDTIRNIQRGATANPKAATIAKIATELKTTSAWLLGETNDSQPQAASEITLAPVTLPDRQAMPADVPVYGTAAASHLNGAFQLEPGIVDFVRRPPALAGATDVYALYIEGTSMEPRYQQGDLVFIHPHRPPRAGDTVIVQMELAPHQIEASIGYLRRRTANHVVLGKLNPEAEVELKRERVRAIHRVLSVNELFGV